MIFGSIWAYFCLRVIWGITCAGYPGRYLYRCIAALFMFLAVAPVIHFAFLLLFLATESMFG
jgi:predicted metal-binding protein